jgi:hypothetical protein
MRNNGATAAAIAAQLNTQTEQANIGGSTTFWSEAVLAAFSLGGTASTLRPDIIAHDVGICLCFAPAGSRHPAAFSVP